MMKRTRVVIAWCLLLVATVVAMPRTWIHHCGRGAELHVDLDHGDHPDQIEHETCPVCDFAGTPTLHSISPIVLVVPHGAALDAPSPASPVASATIWLADLRGPPMA